MVGGLIGLRIFGTVVFNRFASTSFLEESFLVRVDLVKNAWWMIQTNPVFGVGLMNFLVRLPSFAHPYTFYQYLQPVHNMYLLLASEIGIVGLVLSLWFLYKTVCHVQAAPFSSQRTACFLLVASILFLGLFDHYFLTLQAGQLLLAFIFGSCWSLPQKKRQRRNPLNKK
jgi:O-antigen ligase